MVAPTRLAAAVVPRFLAEGRGAIINIASVLAVAPEIVPGIYPATKSYMLTFSQSLQMELGPRGVYVQAVLPAATRTEIWDWSGCRPIPSRWVMEVGELVDAALVGFDRRESRHHSAFAGGRAMGALRRGAKGDDAEFSPGARRRALPGLKHDPETGNPAFAHADPRFGKVTLNQSDQSMLRFRGSATCFTSV